MSLFSSKDSEVFDKLKELQLEFESPEFSGLAFKGNQGPLVRGGYEYRTVILEGYKEAVYTYGSNASPLAGSFGTVNGLIPYLPTVNELLKVASTSANDTAAGTRARSLVLIGLDSNFDPAFEIVPLNGQTPVTLTVGFYRIGRMLVRESGSPNSYSASGNEGTIYLAANSATFAAGVPTDPNLIMDVMLPNRGSTKTDVIPVKAGAEFFLSEITISSTVGNKSDILIVDVRTRQNQSGWRTLTTLEASTTQPVVTMKQNGFQTFAYPFLGGNTDVQCNVRRVGGSGTSETTFSALFI